MNVFGIAKVEKIDNYKMSENLELDFNAQNDNTVVSADLLRKLSIEKVEEIIINEKKCNIYNCVYDKQNNVSGFVYGVEFDYFYKRENFKAYRFEDSDIIFLNNNTQDACGFIKSLNRNSDGTCKMEMVDIDFDLIEEKTFNIQGIVIAGINNAQIRAQAMYGVKLSDNIDYQNLKRKGSISSITIEYTFMEKQYSVIISKRGSMYIRKPSVDLIEGIKIIDDIYKSLLTD